MIRKRYIVLDILAVFLFIISSLLLSNFKQPIKTYYIESDNTIFIYSNVLNVEESKLKKIRKYANKYDIEFELLLSLIRYESGFNNYAINDKNRNGSIDYGLMQLNNRTFREYNKWHLLNFETNLRLGTEFLKWCLDEAGGEVPALAYYNCGIGATLNNRVPDSTLNYISKIIEFKNELKKLTI